MMIKRILKKIYGIVRTFTIRINKSVFTPSYDENKENIILSLTSTTARINHIFLTLYSLTKQTHKPALIVLWLSQDQAYPEHTIKKIHAMGIRIEYRKDLGPNTKYFYAFKEFKNDLVITVDDDIIYHKDMIKELYNTYLDNKELVIARRVHKIRFDSEKQPIKYKDWIWECRESNKPSHEFLATGVGGVLYPPVVTKLNCWENTDFLKVCPTCDDIWLKFCELSNKVKICSVQNSLYYFDVVIKKMQKNCLAKKNIDKGINDECIKSCSKYFAMDNDLYERIISNE